MSPNEPSISEVFDVIIQDFTVAISAYNEGNYSQMNIYSNRMIADSVFAQRSRYGVVGFFLKNLATDFLRLAQSSDSQNALKPFAIAFISKLKEALKPELDFGQVWQGYSAYVDSARKLFMTPVEKQVYKDNKAFTATAFSLLAGELLKGETLFEEQGQVTKGFLNESERLIRNHGAEERDLVFNCLVIALDRLLDYVKFACSAKGADCFKSNLVPLTHRMKEWMEGKEGLPYKDATDTLAAILLEWRLFFLRYTELGRVVPSDERKIELPAEARKRLGDTITEALKKDLGRSKIKK
jgi:hypothetical protein